MNENKMEGIDNNDENKQKSDSHEERRFLKFFNTRVVALFVLGVLIGLTVKTQASKSITMGFDDYKIKKAEKQELNLSDLKKQKEVEEENMEKANQDEMDENGAQESEENELLDGNSKQKSEESLQ